MKRIYLLLIFLFFGYVVTAQKKWSLTDCVLYALDNNLSLKQAQINISFEEIAQKNAKGNLLPSVNASMNHGYNFGRTIDRFTNEFVSEKIRSNQFGAQSRVTLFNGFQLINALKRTEITTEKAGLELKKLQNDISLNVANAYLNILYNKEFMAIAERNLAASESQFDLIKLQVDAGALPQGNLYEIEAQKATDEAALINAQNNLDLSFLILKQIIQLKDENFDIITPDISTISADLMPSSPQGIVLHALENFPDVLVAKQEIIDADYGLKIAQGGNYPSLSLSYSIGTGYSGARKAGVNPQTLSFPIGSVASTNETVLSLPQEVFSSFEVQPFGEQITGNINHSLFLTLSIPIFNGWSTSSRVERAKLTALAADYRMQETQQNLEQDIARAFLDAKAAWKNYQSAQKTEIAAQKAFEYAQVKFEQGVINLVEFNLARTQLDNASAQLIRNKFDYVFKVKVLEFYQGNSISDF